MLNIQQRGVALVLVLWVAVLLTVMASSFVFSTRTDTVLAQNLSSTARAQALADGAIQRMIFETMRPPNDMDRWQGDGLPRVWSTEDAVVNVIMRDESGKIDLNTGMEPLLLGLFKNAGLNEAAAMALLDAVLDWRDPDDMKRPNGAEATEYEAAAAKYRPTNTYFESVDELRRVRGVTPELFARLEPELTVDSRETDFNPVAASRQVLLSLPGVEVGVVDAYLAERKAALLARQPLPVFPPLAGAAVRPPPSVYSVRAEVRLEDGAVFVRDAVIRIMPGAPKPYQIRVWKEGAPEVVATENKGGSGIGSR